MALAPSHATTPPKTPLGRIKGIYLLVMCCSAFASFPAFIVLLLGSLPTFSAWMYDRSANKSIGLSIGFMNMCGMLPHLLHVFPLGQKMYLAASLLQDMKMWLMIYAVTFIGWMIIVFLPSLIRGYLEIQLEREKEKILQTQKILIEEWGEAITHPAEK